MIMKRKTGLGAIAVSAAIVCSAAAPAPAAAQMFLTTPDFKPGPIEGSDPLVGIPIPGATATEYRAHLLWNLRAGLNVSALMCQFSPFLRAVPNYNGLLAHHSEELASAYTALGGYFRRVHGAKPGQKLFDDYSTTTYNNFSTLQAQAGFCQVATNIIKEALAAPKGQLHAVARNRMRELRNSLIPAHDPAPAYNPNLIQPAALPALPPLRDECWTRKGKFRSRCAAAG